MSAPSVCHKGRQTPKSAPARCGSDRLCLGLALALAALLACPARGWAACTLRVGDAPADIRIAYDVFAAASAPVPLSVTLANDGDGDGNGACPAEFRLLGPDGSPVDAVVIQGTAVRVGIAPAGPRGGGSSGTWRVSVPPHSSLPVALEATIVTDGTARPGDNVGIATLEVAAEGAVAGRIPLRVVLASPARAQINISGVDGTFGQGGTVGSVDLGLLETGLSRRLFLQLRANTVTRLSITSAGGGRMLPTDGNRSAEAFIPYRLRVDAEEVDLSARWDRQPTPPLDARGLSLPMDLTVGTTGDRPAGRYADTITIEVSPL